MSVVDANLTTHPGFLADSGDVVAGQSYRSGRRRLFVRLALGVHLRERVALVPVAGEDTAFVEAAQGGAHALRVAP